LSEIVEVLYFLAHTKIMSGIMMINMETWVIGSRNLLNKENNVGRLFETLLSLGWWALQAKNNKYLKSVHIEFTVPEF